MGHFNNVDRIYDTYLIRIFHWSSLFTAPLSSGQHPQISPKVSIVPLEYCCNHPPHPGICLGLSLFNTIAARQHNSVAAPTAVQTSRPVSPHIFKYASSPTYNDTNPRPS